MWIFERKDDNGSLDVREAWHTCGFIFGVQMIYLFVENEENKIVCSKWFFFVLEG